MKKRDWLALFLALLVMLPPLAMADQDKEEDNANFKVWKTRRSHAGFNGFGGFFVMGMPQKSKALDQLTDDMQMGRFSEMAYGMGGYGLVHLGGGWRIGGSGAGVSTTSKSIFTDPVTGDRYNRKAEYDFGYGGFLLEYSPWMIGRVNFGVGALFGGGGVELEMWQDEGVFSWEDIQDPFVTPPSSADSPTNVNTSIEQGFFVVRPYVTARIHILDWMALEGQVGYFWTSFQKNSWQMNLTEMNGDGPDLDLNQPDFRIGLAFGG